MKKAVKIVPPPWEGARGRKRPRVYMDFNSPPSIGILVPVIKEACSEAKKATRYPYSSGLPYRPTGTLEIICLSTSEIGMPKLFALLALSSLILSVLKYPVSVLFTVMLYLPTSVANDLDQVTTAARMVLERVK